jgi:Protein of unknown function (DUF2585)
MHDSEQPLFTRPTLATAIALTVVFGALLYVAGRPAWCQSGFGLWSPAWSRCTSQHVLDPYSFSHVLHGIIFYWMLRPLASRIGLPWRVVGALALEIGWELLENSPWVIERYRQQTAALDYTGDSIVNSFGDVVTTGIGIVFARSFSWKASVVLFVIFELWMLYLARDNLTLNIIMLFFPIEAIKEWQMPG